MSWRPWARLPSSTANRFLRNPRINLRFVNLRHMRFSVAASAALLAVGPGAIGAQVVRVSGRVIDEGRSTPIEGATVRLTGVEAQITDGNGRFRFAATTPGRMILSVEAVGHSFRSIELDVQSDTSVTVVMRSRVVTLDTIVVRARSVRIEGTVVDSATGTRLLQAQATLYPGSRTVGALSGMFMFDDAPTGEVTLVVEALEHRPTRVTFHATRDTSLTIALGIDSVAIRMIQMQVERLAQRSRPLALSLVALNREAIGREGVSSIGELVTRQLFEDRENVRRAAAQASADDGCIFLDDVKVTRDVFEGLPPEVIERVEIYRGAGETPSIRGRSSARRTIRAESSMIRVYTRRYVASLLGREMLPKLFYMRSGVKPMCM